MKKSSFAVIVLFFLLYILPLGVRPIVIPDEARYAEIPREMIASGDWVDPHLDGVRYFEKPVLGYWLNAASMIVFGGNSFAVRFPSAMAVGISALMVFFLVRRFAGRYSDALLASTALFTCLEVFGIGTFSVLDSMFSMFVTAAMASFFFAHMEGRSRKRIAFLALFGVFCGLAFLTKGFIGFAVPVLAIVPFMIWERRWKELFRVCWMPFLIAILVSLPWAVMIHLREPDFWHYFFWNEHIRRFMSDRPQHPYPLWFFIPIILGGALPWTALLPAAFQGVRFTRLRDSIFRFAICWLLFPFLFFSASHGKLGTYILPCFPPLVILITVGLQEYLQGEKRRAFTIGALSLAMVTCILAVILVVSQVTGFPGFRSYGPAEIWKWVVVAAGLMACSGLLACSVRSLNFRKQIVLFCAAPLLFMFSTQFVMPDQIKIRKAPGELLLRNFNRIRPDTILVTNDLARAVCWFYKRDDVYLLEIGGELTYGLGYDKSRHRLLTVGQLRKLIAEMEGEKQVVFITETEHYSRYRSLLPKPVFEDIDGRFVFAQF